MTNTTRNSAERGGLRRVAALCLAFGLAVLSPGRLFAGPDLTLPAGARLTGEITSEGPDSYLLPIGPWADGALPQLRTEGLVQRRAWRLDGAGLTTLQVLAPLRAQLVAAGFEIIFECKAAGCGGFDFRFATEVLPAPAMHVDLTDFRFLAATSEPGTGPAIHVSLLVSRSLSASFVQMISVTPEGGTVPDIAPPDPDPESGISRALPRPAAATPLGQRLETAGHAVLADLTFETGSSRLGPGPFASLTNLAGYLRAHPGRAVALVGHTDSTGSLAANIALSKRRAASVADRLVAAHGIPRKQISAEGVGYLAPLSTNLTDAGREANRRVEAVLIATE